MLITMATSRNGVGALLDLPVGICTSIPSNKGLTEAPSPSLIPNNPNIPTGLRGPGCSWPRVAGAGDGGRGRQLIMMVGEGCVRSTDGRRPQRGGSNLAGDLRGTVGGGLETGNGVKEYRQREAWQRRFAGMGATGRRYDG